jgi:predicted polyphosphate/ATP-dependent NAD kinase
MRKIGFIINPVAGIGGKVGLKGSDGVDTQKKAFALGAIPESRFKAETTLQTLASQMSEDGTEIEILTWSGEMGEDVVKNLRFRYSIVGGARRTQTTTGEDTVSAARALLRAGAEVLLFAGGDGTARDILDAVGTDIPVVGIPAGCKIHSAVYAVNPKAAGELTFGFITGGVKELRNSEVMDIDESLFRENRVEAKLYGYLKTPAAARMQNLKSGRGYSESGALAFLSRYVADTLKPETLYIVGGGSTTKAVMDTIGLSGTLLGVDLFETGKRTMKAKLLKRDVSEKDILSALDTHSKAVILVTVIGGQGYLFGRGNQQISADVIKRVGKENILIVATKEKMNALFGQGLLVDTGDEKTNEYVSGYYKVAVGYEDFVMFPVTA